MRSDIVYPNDAQPPKKVGMDIPNLLKGVAKTAGIISYEILETAKKETCRNCKKNIL